MIFDVILRLEPDPHQHDLARGWRAEVADPAWMVGRQWQMGEHQGEDAASPVRVEVTARETPISPVEGQPKLDPRVVPAEAVVESERGDWWTAGRRVRIGRAVAAAARGEGVPLPAEDGLLLDGLASPYDVLDGTGPDGRRLWRRRAELGLDPAWFGPTAPPDEPADLWDPAQLTYAAEFRAGGASLDLDRHDGGDLDWFSVDATGQPGTSASASTSECLPGRMRYPSAPLPRWWQIEDAQVSIGGHAPDRAALATLVLIDLVVNNSDDWFTFAIPARAGGVLTLDQVTVVDSFGESWPLSPPEDWSLFRTHGLDARSLVLWATASTPLVGPVLDEVVLGMDEDANLVWAVEQVVGGRTTTLARPGAPGRPTQPGDGRTSYSYRPMTPIPPHWHPYVIEQVGGRRRFVQGRAADLSPRKATLLPPPVSDLLRDPRRTANQPVHQIEPAAIPSDGIRVERRAILARATTGEPVLWTQRRRQPLYTPPALGLRFDVLEAASTPAT